MNALVTAIADLVKTFCSGIVSLVVVPAQMLHTSFGFVVYALPFAFLGFFAVLQRKKIFKNDGEPKLLNNNKKENRK